MTTTRLKTASRSARDDAGSVHDTVQGILADIRARGEQAVLELAASFDNYTGPVILDGAAIERACNQVPPALRDDISYARANIARFAEAQKASIRDMECEVVPGLLAGQKHIPVSAVGCYIPGGRYAHVASALMTVTTARVAGCKHVLACAPARGEAGIAPAQVYAAHISGADTIIALGGVQGIAAMTFGLFGLPPVQFLIGPGNQYVAEAKRILFGQVGIDMLAGPTDSLIIADDSADPLMVATDLVSQAEHGYNSPVWLVTGHRPLAERVMTLVPELIDALDGVNRDNAAAAWRDYGEVYLCSDREDMVRTADSLAPEHLTVQAVDPGWWLERLSCYGSLFLGEETTVSFGDKASGPNHVLPTAGSATWTGGLSVHKLMKVVTWQRATRAGVRDIARATARISRLEGMEAHARSADIRLARYFPDATPADTAE